MSVIKHVLPADPPWLKWAFALEGTREIVGRNHNPVIVKFFADVGWAQYRDDETAWCGAFAGAAMVAFGVSIPKIAVRAREWLNWGFGTKSPRRGDIAVFSRGSGNQGHVAFFLAEEGNYVWVLGGNQSDAVTVARYSKDALLGYRAKEDIIDVPHPNPIEPEDLFASVAPYYMAEFMGDFEVDVDDAAAVFGNFGYESAGFTKLQEVKPSAGRGGWGWPQWTADRRVAFEKWCREKGYDPSSNQANYEYVVYELSETWEERALDALEDADTLYDKVVAFEKAYERAGVKNYAERMKWAEKAKAAYKLWVQGDHDIGKAPPAPSKPSDGEVGTGAVAVGTGLFLGLADYVPWGWVGAAVGVVIAVLILIWIFKEK